MNMNDLSLIQGAFPIRPSLPSIAGNEGVGRVLAESITKWGLREKQMLNVNALARLLVNEQSGVSASDLSVSHLAAWH